MEKLKRDEISPEMRRRLRENRDGRLTTTQWIDMITAPLITLLIVAGLALIVFGGRLFVLVRAWWLVIPLVLLTLVIPVVLRAIRYARMPIYCDRLYAGVRLQPLWVFWQPMMFYTELDEPVKFRQRLAPPFPMHIDREYLVYYFNDVSGKVLLSAIPTDHEDSKLYEPTEMFLVRQSRRAGS